MFASVVNGVTTTYGINSLSDDSVGKEDFLQLLVVQMQNQDPLDPIKNEDYLAQLAQFNSLEQMINLNETLQSMSSMQTLASSSNLLGKTIEALDNAGNTLEGKVSQIRFYEGDVLVTFSDGADTYEVGLGNVVKVRES